MRNLLILFFCLAIFSCRDEKTAPASTTLYPIEVVKTESYNTTSSSTKFIYDANRRLIREETLLDNVPDSYKLYDYDAEGKLTTISYYNNKNVLLEQNYLTYKPSGQLDRFSHAYIDTSGNKLPHHYRDFEYDVKGKIIRQQDYSPTGTLQKNISIKDESDLQIQVEERGADNAISLKSISTFDNKNHPLLGTGINFITQLRPGNVIANKLYDAAGNEIVAWSKEIIYNSNGYPLKIVQTFSNGITKTETYTYSTLN